MYLLFALKPPAVKVLAFLLIAFVVCAAFVEVNVSKIRTPFKAKHSINKKQLAIGCRPDPSSIDFNDPDNSIPLLAGWGKYRMAVTHSNDSADIYFQQGINMYYGFHIIEAMASFEKAIRLDSAFAMAYWGKALAYGPNINDVGYAASPDAIAAIQKARSLCNNCTPVEKALINAMEVRYSLDSTAKREDLNQRYADAMKEVHQRFPTNADAAALYADALMVQHPWDLYDRSYNPKPWTPEIVRVLERLIKEFPENPGANHYYIHAIEGSKHPQKGLIVADRLGQYMPGVAHLVHMPSHIYIRSGNYKKGIEVNEAAVSGYQAYLSKYPAVSNGVFLYLMHNVHMKAACASMDGMYTKAMQYATETRNSVDTSYLNAGGYFGMYSQYMFMTPLFTQVRFGKWNEILNTAPIAESYVYARSMQRFARGLAYARLKQLDKASAELGRLKDSANSVQLQDHPVAFNPGIAAVEVAEKILQGVIAEEKGQLTDAIDFFNKAVDLEDGMLYNEPKDWVLPARHYLANALLKAKQYSAAEKVHKQDLLINPNNRWSLTGLKLALGKQGKSKEAASLKIEKASFGDDFKIAASVF